MANPDADVALIRPVAQIRHSFRGMRTASTNQRMRQLLLEPLAEWAENLAQEDNPVEAAAVASTISLALSDYMATLNDIEARSFRVLMPLLVNEILECMIEFDAQALAVASYLAEMLEGTWIRPPTPPAA